MQLLKILLSCSTKVFSGFKYASSLSLSSILVWGKKKAVYFLNTVFALKECYLYSWNFCV